MNERSNRRPSSKVQGIAGAVSTPAPVFVSPSPVIHTPAPENAGAVSPVPVQGEASSIVVDAGAGAVSSLPVSVSSGVVTEGAGSTPAGAQVSGTGEASTPQGSTTGSTTPQGPALGDIEHARAVMMVPRFVTGRGTWTRNQAKTVRVLAGAVAGTSILSRDAQDVDSAKDVDPSHATPAALLSDGRVSVTVGIDPAVLVFMLGALSIKCEGMPATGATLDERPLLADLRQMVPALAKSPTAAGALFEPCKAVMVAMTQGRTRDDALSYLGRMVKGDKGGKVSQLIAHGRTTWNMPEVAPAPQGVTPQGGQGADIAPAPSQSLAQTPAPDTSVAALASILPKVEAVAVAA